MRKVWQSKRNGIPGVYVEWYDDDHRRRSKYFAPEFKKFAKTFMARKFAELNADVRPIGSVIDVPWDSFVSQYLDEKETEGLKSGSLAELVRSLKYFRGITKIQGTGQLTARVVNEFIKARKRMKTRNGKAVSLDTVNKDIRNLRSLIIWGQKKRFVGELEIKETRTPDKELHVLTDAEIVALLRAAQHDPQWHMRILLALCTGLRSSTLGKLHVEDFDLTRRAISVVDKKTGKLLLYQPLPDDVMPVVERFLSEQIAPGQVRFFKYGWSKKWYKILDMAGLRGKIEFHDLRRTFASRQADAGTPIAAVQAMLQHSDVKTTMKHYIRTNDSVKREGVNRLGVRYWLA